MSGARGSRLGEGLYEVQRLRSNTENAGEAEETKKVKVRIKTGVSWRAEIGLTV